MAPLVPEILTRPWWTWNAETAGVWDSVYRGFNLSEAAVWFLLAALVLRRWIRFRQSPLEGLYAAAFAIFGVTDLLEASQQSAALVAVKGIVLAAVLILRGIVRSRWYPASSFY